MTLRTKARRFAEDAVVEVIVSFATHNDTVRFGERRRGADETVRAHPNNFVLDGTPRSEWPDVWGNLEVPQHSPEFAWAKQKPTVVVHGAVVCVTGFTMLKTGVRQSRRAAWWHLDDPVVRAHPGYFAPLRVPDPAA